MKGIPADHVDDINQKLWARKRLRIRRERNENAKNRKTYFKLKAQDSDATEVPDKQREFYKSLLQKEELLKGASVESKQKKYKSKNSDAKKDKSEDEPKPVKRKLVDILKAKKGRQEQKKQDEHVAREKQWKQKRRYAHQINRRTDKG